VALVDIGNRLLGVEGSTCGVGAVVAIVAEHVLGSALKVCPEFGLGWEADDVQALPAGCGGTE